MSKFFKKFNSVIQSIVIAVFLILILTTITQVFMRYVVNRPIMWADELTRFLLIWGTLLGCGVAIYYKKHISMDFLVDKLPPKGKKAAEAIVWIILLLFSSFYIFKGSIIAFNAKDTVLTALGISKLFYFGAIPVSAIVWFLFSLQRVLNSFGVGAEEAENDT